MPTLACPRALARLSSRPPSRRALSTTPARAAHRALVYAQPGTPSSVLRALTFPTLPPPARGTATVRFLAAPLNPADVNALEGAYPARAARAADALCAAAGEEVRVGGNEGVAEVVEAGEGAGVKPGDWVLVAKPQSGTWTSAANHAGADLIPLARSPKLTAAHAATLTVNPPTAWNMLHDFVALAPGDWVLQNGANSAVGQNVIQLAAHLGARTLNFVRDRPEAEAAALDAHLKGLGAEHVFTYGQLDDRAFVRRVGELTGGAPIRLFLNCVGGAPTQAMAKLLRGAHGAHVVTYGGMARAPLSLPSGLFIFNGLAAHGFWQHAWYAAHSRTERVKVLDELLALIEAGKLAAPPVEHVTLPGHLSDAEVTAMLPGLLARHAADFRGRKLMLQIEDVPE